MPGPMSPIARAPGVYDSGDDGNSSDDPLAGRAEAKKRKKGEQKSPQGNFLGCFYYIIFTGKHVSESSTEDFEKNYPM